MVTDSEGQANRKPLERQSKEGVLAALSEWGPEGSGDRSPTRMFT